MFLKEIKTLRQKFRHIKAVLDERARRVWAATEAKALGQGGITAVHKATGIARSTLYRGLEELNRRPLSDPKRQRKPGGGRKTLQEKQPRLDTALDSMLDAMTRGDPESPLRWTCRSTRDLRSALVKKDMEISHMTVHSLLRRKGYSMQSNKKVREGKSHPDRNAQFEHIARRVKEMQRRREVVLSVDTKKKELVGDFKNAGATWRPKGKPLEVRTHDFMDPDLGKAIPYGVYDLAANKGWVSVGITSDTAEFAVNTISRWWRSEGKKRYPQASEILITADGGGSNGSRNRLWKVSLQRFSDKTGLTIAVSHFPPGTSKWNKIEHRLFSFITKKWAGQPLDSHATIIDLISSTKTETGLTVKAVLDSRKYETGRKVSDAEMADLNIFPERFHGEWNYTIRPRRLKLKKAA